MSTLMKLVKRPASSSASVQTIERRFKHRLRIPAVTVHPILHGDHKYLRALRAAEMAAWDAGLPLELARRFAEAIATGQNTR